MVGGVMLKGLFRLIGILVVVMVLIIALLCYLDTKGLLFGHLGELVHNLRILGRQAWQALVTFNEETGIVDDAKEVIDSGIDKLEYALEPHPVTPTPTLLPEITPMPTQIP